MVAANWTYKAPNIFLPLRKTIFLLIILVGRTSPQLIILLFFVTERVKKREIKWERREMSRQNQKITSATRIREILLFQSCCLSESVCVCVSLRVCLRVYVCICICVRLCVSSSVCDSL